jgi:hypothetical protein
MTLAEAGEIFRHWQQNPPAHLMLQTIACLLGWSPAAASRPAPDEVLAAPPPGIAVTRGDTGMPVPVLDAEALRARNLEMALALDRSPRPPRRSVS